MNRSSLAIFTALLATISTAHGDVVPDSPFAQARHPASVLDVELDRQTLSWNMTLQGSLCDEMLTVLICATKSVVRLDHTFPYDHLEAHVSIQDLLAFLALEREERKALIEQLVATIEGRLARLITLENAEPESARLFTRRYLKLELSISRLENQRGESSQVLMPDKRLFGHAGFVDGTFFFSNPYFLDLRLARGSAVTGDAASFTVERDTYSVP